jgi:hypothetical protein
LHDLSFRGCATERQAELPLGAKDSCTFAATALYPQRLEPASNGSFAQKECLATESMPFPLQIQQQHCVLRQFLQKTFGRDLTIGVGSCGNQY